MKNKFNQLVDEVETGSENKIYPVGPINDDDDLSDYDASQRADSDKDLGDEDGNSNFKNDS